MVDVSEGRIRHVSCIFGLQGLGSGSKGQNQTRRVECRSLHDEGGNPRALVLDESLLEVGVANWIWRDN
jgi:hypothetical protein